MNWFKRMINSLPESEPSRAVVTPDWMRKALQLPPWASVADEYSHKVCICIKVDTASAMLEWLQLLGAPLDALTQYWLECAYQCVKLDVQSAIANSDFDPRTAPKAAEFHFDRAPEYEQAKFPPGPAKKVTVDGQELTLRGADLATRAREAREHYKRIRGRLPF